MATSQIVHEGQKALKEGFLEKRQRGRNVKSDNQLKKLKFQKRYCVLTLEGLTYSKDEVTKQYSLEHSGLHAQYFNQT